MLHRIVVCQSEICQNKGSKSIWHRLQSLYNEKYKQTYPDLKIEPGECQGDCEMGPVVQVNDSIWLRRVDKETADALLEKPEQLVGEVMHVLEKDRETFERIIKGDLY